MNLNKVIIVGRLTGDIALKNTQGGTAVASASIATNRVWTDKSGTKQEEVEFHNVIFWGRQAEIASQYLQKGSLLLVEGRIRTRKWEDKDGLERRTTEIVVENLQLGACPEATKAAPKSAPKAEPPLDSEDEEREREMKELFG